MSSNDGRSLTVHIGIWLRTRMTIRYDVYLDKIPAINTSYKNNATMTAKEIRSKIRLQTFCSQFLDGDFNGRKYSFTIHKKVKMVKRADAIFAVTADDTGEQKWEPSKLMRMVLLFHYWFDQTSLYGSRIQAQQAMFSLKDQSRSARMILEMTSPVIL